MKASVIIRTKNEAKRIEDVLKALSNQTEKDFEVVIVDSGSNDKTLDIVDSFKDKLDIKVFKIPQEDFTYPYACNFGAEKSSGKYLVYLSGHSVPIDNNWLGSGLSDFTSDKIAGVYGAVRASADASITEKIFYFMGKYPGLKKILSRKRFGILGNTNSIIPKKLWSERHFNGKFISGGEDSEWANYFLQKGYKIVRDPKFSVYHSHGLSLLKFFQQYKNWKKTYNQI